MSNLMTYLGDENGASAAEYALILAIVGAAIATAALFLGTMVANSIGKAGNCINQPSTAC